jgi:4-hydroxybenzoate polyprenyltransferase
MRDLSIIVIVAIVALAGCAIMAVAEYFVDRNVDKQDKRR